MSSLCLRQLFLTCASRCKVQLISGPFVTSFSLIVSWSLRWQKFQGSNLSEQNACVEKFCNELIDLVIRVICMNKYLKIIKDLDSKQWRVITQEISHALFVITPLETVVLAGTMLHMFIQPMVRTKRFKKYLAVPFYVILSV